ncbi:MAG TPA: hypothetical protein VL020_07025 [Pseudomonadales bacterium]|nr:hypothetical protein [Pseudomonadales bacterium]
MRVTTHYQKVSVKGVYRWKDPETGRPRQRTKEFFQTINPFNRMPDGALKDRSQILNEINAERDAWLAEQVVLP